MGFDELIKVAAQNGIWALMSVCLIIYTLKKNDGREKRLINTVEKNQEVIKNLSESLKCVDAISDDIKSIQKCINERKRC